MLGFQLTGDSFAEFLRRVELLEPWEDTEENRTKIMIQMANEGLIERVFQTERSKEEYIKDVKKHLKVLDLTNKIDETLDAQWCINNENGQSILVSNNPPFKILAYKDENGNIVEKL